MLRAISSVHGLDSKGKYILPSPFPLARTVDIEQDVTHLLGWVETGPRRADEGKLLVITSGILQAGVVHVAERVVVRVVAETEGF